ncbi:MAG: DNA mismatch endonuclease Vsr [Tannerella sp.]|nr:DNA mismatch endonuclease Vsr [Tannerella sp.]
MDIWSKEKRSEVMSKIRSRDTKPELALRKSLFARGFRYRVNDRHLPGKPDIVLPKYKTVIFLHGCFWHGHEDCKYASMPKTNTAFWIEKITSNVKRTKSIPKNLWLWAGMFWRFGNVKYGTHTNTILHR